jgi:hypothetical protein
LTAHAFFLFLSVRSVSSLSAWSAVSWLFFKFFGEFVYGLNWSASRNFAWFSGLGLLLLSLLTPLANFTGDVIRA